MLIATLLREHDRCAPRGSLRDSIGDGYLCTHNRVYRRIRRQTRRVGGRFTTSDYCHYRQIPLLALEQLMERRLLVYQDNVSVLRTLEARRPRAYTHSEIRALEYPICRLFHESAHLVADQVFPAARDRREIVLRSMLSESFANSCEFVGNVDAVNPTHRAFFALNSMWGGRDAHAGLRRALAAFEAKALFEMIFLCFLRANFLFAAFAPQTLAEDHARVFAGPCPGARALAAAAPVFDAPFELSLQFRLVTSRQYFRLIGITGPLQRLLAFDPIRALARHAGYRAGVDALVAAVTRRF